MRLLFRVIVGLHFCRKNVYSSTETLIFLHKLQAFRSGVLLERLSSRIKLRLGQQLLSKLPLFQPLEDSKRYDSGKGLKRKQSQFGHISGRRIAQLRALNSQSFQVTPKSRNNVFRKQVEISKGEKIKTAFQVLSCLRVTYDYLDN